MNMMVGVPYDLIVVEACVGELFFFYVGFL